MLAILIDRVDKFECHAGYTVLGSAETSQMITCVRGNKFSPPQLKPCASIGHTLDVNLPSAFLIIPETCDAPSSDLFGLIEGMKPFIATKRYAYSCPAKRYLKSIDKTVVDLLCTVSGSWYPPMEKCVCEKFGFFVITH